MVFQCLSILILSDPFTVIHYQSWAVPDHRTLRNRAREEGVSQRRGTSPRVNQNGGGVGGVGEGQNLCTG